MGVEKKAKAFLENNQVKLTTYTTTQILAEVQGSQPQPYRISVFRDGKWSCECRYFTEGVKDGLPPIWECAHALAVKLHPFYKVWILKIDTQLGDGNEVHSDHRV